MWENGVNPRNWLKQAEFYALILINQKYTYLPLVDTFYMGLESTVQLQYISFLSV